MDCEQFTLNGYNEFVSHIFNRLEGIDRTPLSGGLEITSRCNLRCVHCYLQDTSFTNELTYEQICNILDQIADEGCLWLLITGGEPLLRPDFADIYIYAKRKGFLITLFTNGTMLTSHIADLLKDDPPFRIEISLYGMTIDTYERITGVPGSFERCIRGINLLMERKLPLNLKTVAITLNKHEIQDMKKYAASLGIQFRFDPMINPTLNGLTTSTMVRLSPQEIVELDMADEERASSWSEVCDSQWGAWGGDNRLYTCGAGRKGFYITSTGELAECTIGRRTNYNLLRGTFHEGFYKAMPQILAQQRTRHSECQACPMIKLCGNCVSWADLECGDPEASVDFLCQVAQLRVATFKKGYLEETLVKSR